MKAQRLPSDIISTLPLAIIETILCLMPIQDAVRTSILSRKWRYNWVKIPTLVFDDEDMVKKSIDRNADLSEMEQRYDAPSQRIKLPDKCRFFYAIYQVLLLHQGPIHELTLIMDADETCVEIDHIILHLLRNNNTVKKFTLDTNCGCAFKLPLSIFSLHQLTDLHLGNCTLTINPRTRFNGSSSLTSLYLDNVFTTQKTLLRLISNTPLLKSLTLIDSEKKLLWAGHSTIIELFECLPVIEHLDMFIWVIECFAGDGIPREIPTSLVHLKYFCLDGMCFADKYGLPFVALLIRSSPNLEKIKLLIFNDTLPNKSEIDSVKLEDYSDIWLDHLNELEIEDFSSYTPELEFVKLILVKSPMLKKVRIVLDRKVAKDNELHLLRSLLRSPRASPVVEIIVDH